jgi:cytosine deaminase
LADGRTADIALEDGVIAAVEPVGARPVGDASVEHLSGFVVVPSLIEPHAHLDKAFTAGSVTNLDGSLNGAIEAWLPARASHQARDIATRAWAATRRYLQQGTTAIRAHTDVGPGIDLRALDAIVAVRAAAVGTVDLQIVALCSCPLTGVAGADNRARLLDAIAAGADLVGGAPHIDPDPVGAVDFLASAAADAGLPLDLHIDETLNPASPTLARLVEIARGGFERPIAASHCVSLGVQPAQRQAQIAADLAETGISVVTLPQTNLYLQGRGHASSTPRGLTAVRALLDAGVEVAAGGDNLQDPFNPMSRIDPFETASLLVVAGHVRPGEALRTITDGGRAVMGLDPGGIDAGRPADLVAVRAVSVDGAMADGPAERIVIRAGRVVARTTAQTTTALDSLEPGPWR